MGPKLETGKRQRKSPACCLAAERMPVGHEVAIATAQLPGWNYLLFSATLGFAPCNLLGKQTVGHVLPAGGT